MKRQTILSCTQRASTTGLPLCWVTRPSSRPWHWRTFRTSMLRKSVTATRNTACFPIIKSTSKIRKNLRLSFRYKMVVRWFLLLTRNWPSRKGTKVRWRRKHNQVTKEVSSSKVTLRILQFSLDLLTTLLLTTCNRQTTSASRTPPQPTTSQQRRLTLWFWKVKAPH